MTGSGKELEGRLPVGAKATFPQACPRENRQQLQTV
jgi:hypothetical protein